MKVYSEYSGSSLGMGSAVNEQWAVHAVLVDAEAVLWQRAGKDPGRKTSTRIELTEGEAPSGLMIESGQYKLLVVLDHFLSGSPVLNEVGSRTDSSARSRVMTAGATEFGRYQVTPKYISIPCLTGTLHLITCCWGIQAPGAL